jgi:hypothetical protein
MRDSQTDQNVRSNQSYTFRNIPAIIEYVGRAGSDHRWEESIWSGNIDLRSSVADCARLEEERPKRGGEVEVPAFLNKLEDVKY